MTSNHEFINEVIRSQLLRHILKVIQHIRMQLHVKYVKYLCYLHGDRIRLNRIIIKAPCVVPHNTHNRCLKIAFHSRILLSLRRYPGTQIKLSKPAVMK